MDVVVSPGQLLFLLVSEPDLRVRGSGSETIFLFAVFFLFYRVVDIIITASPVGLLKSSLTASTTPQQWFVDVTWTPTSSQSGPHIFCYYAVNCIG